MISSGVIGIASRLSMVPRSVSRVTDSAVKISMVRVRIVPISPGTMLSALERRRVVAGVLADLERRRRDVGDGAVVLQRGAHDLRERAERRPGRHRIGRVGGDQQRRPVAAAQRALEVGRDLDREQHLPGRQQMVDLGLVASAVRHLEVAGVLQRRHDRAADVARSPASAPRSAGCAAWC